ncbi:MAG: aldehyde dehydrogenase family protein [Bacteroidota bacterium]|nr:aldehyde dehydrogenase family protein [Bacteroidota bacterium]
MAIPEVVASQRAFFDSQATRSVDFRIQQLKKLETILRNNEDDLAVAIYADLKKSRYDMITTELSLVLGEISTAIKKLPAWTKKQRVATNLVNFPARSYRLAEPYGVTYIAGAWNYPYQLTLLPLVSAMAAGNTAVIKPSELAVNTSHTLAKLINENFPSEYIHVIEGGAETATEILQQKFDKIFFTGGARIGKIVYEAAARQLTPVTLELGGKNPAIVLPDCNISVTAKRLVWGKFLNAGQSCVAPDYLLVHSSIEQKLLGEMKRLLDKYFSTEKITENFMAIVDDRHFERLKGLINPDKVFYGGVTKKEDRFISPTILRNMTFDDDVMKEEIFGPILPAIRFDSLDDVVKKITRYEKPLSFYVYGKKSETTEKLFNNFSFGGGSLNDSVMYFGNSNLPLGGIGASGIGAYHGYEGFKTFSHYKSIMEKGMWIEFWFLKSPPYAEWKLKILRFLLEKL